MHFSKKGFLVGVDRIYKKYMDDLKEKPECPLCHRAFSGDAEMESLSHDVRFNGFS
jgi:hypothetical protein